MIRSYEICLLDSRVGGNDNKGQGNDNSKNDNKGHRNDRGAKITREAEIAWNAGMIELGALDSRLCGNDYKKRRNDNEKGHNNNEKHGNSISSVHALYLMFTSVMSFYTELTICINKNN